MSDWGPALGSATALAGRESECAEIDRRLDAARSGHGGALILRGPAGIGKSGLMAHAAAAGGLRVQAVAAVEPEADLAYATLHRLLLPVLDRVGELPPPQATAIEVILGRSAGPTPDRFLVGLGTLSLLSIVAADQPILCLVDDAHWADESSRSVLEFVARRLDDEPIALLFAVREGEGRSLPGIEEMIITGLDPAASAEVVRSRGVDLPDGPRDQLIRQAAGNPLALHLIPADIDARAMPWGITPIPITTDLQHTFDQWVRQPDAATRLLLLLLAADGAGRTHVIDRAARLLGLEPSMLGTGCLDHLIMVEEGAVSFRHPLIRSAVYQGASVADRQGVHRALATALEADPMDLPRRAWHLGQSAVGVDESVAAVLEQAAEQTRNRAGRAGAAAALERAADLSPRSEARNVRLVAAASARWEGGDVERARHLLDRAEESGPLVGSAGLDLITLRAMIEIRTGTPAVATALLAPMITESLAEDLPRALRLLMLQGEVGYQSNQPEVWTDLVAAIERLDLTGNEPQHAIGRLLRASTRTRSGRPLGLADGDLDTVQRVDDPLLLVWISGLAWGIGRQDLSLRLRHRAAQVARDSGAIGTLALALEFLAASELAEGRLRAAEDHVEEGIRFALETGQASLACRHRGQLALIHAHQGREDARRLAAESLSESSDRGLAVVTALGYRTLGMIELIEGRAENALAEFEATDPGAAGHPGVALQVAPDRVEAAARCGRPDRVGPAYADFIRWAEGTGAAGLRGIAARCRGLLADDEAIAEAYFCEAIELHAQAGQPLERARTELLLGEQLRRSRRQIDARRPLRAAWHTFVRLGAHRWAARAEQEMRAAGELPPQQHAAGEPELTHQEQRIIDRVAEGRTNREIAAQLFLSPRTVEYHLRKVFHKLGVRSRAELVRFSLERRDEVGVVE